MPPTPYIDHGWPADSWWGTDTPTTGPVGTSATYVGIRFGVEVAGRLAGFRRYDNAGQDGMDHAVLCGYDTRNIYRAVAWRPRASYEGAAWHNVWFRPYLRVNASTEGMLLCVFFGNGQYHRNNTALTSPVERNNITFVNGFQSTNIAPWRTTLTLNTNANAVDVLFYPDSH